MSDLIVEVTQEDIERGHRLLSWSCPIARATKRALGIDEEQVNVDEDEMVITGHSWTDRRRYYARGQKTFVRNFDRGKPVKPHRFVFKVVR